MCISFFSLSSFKALAPLYIRTYTNPFVPYTPAGGAINNPKSHMYVNILSHAICCCSVAAVTALFLQQKQGGGWKLV